MAPVLPADDHPTELLGQYTNSWAFVVGIDRYASFRPLQCATNDADAFARTLIERLGFPASNVRVLLDPAPAGSVPYTLVPAPATRDAMEDLLFSNLDALGRDDRVVVFFAGHGVSKPSPRPGGQPVGYLVPTDAVPDRLHTMLGMDRLTTELNRALAAKHVLFVLDCCYSGLAGTRGPTPAPYFTEKMLRHWCREVLTAGTSEEAVLDQYQDGHSLFTYALLEGLNGAADSNDDKVITAVELHAYVAGQVQARGNGYQLPELYPLADHDQGAQFVFGIDPIRFDPAAVPELVLDGRRRVLPAPRFTFLNDPRAALAAAAAEVEAALREVALGAGGEHWHGDIDRVASDIEDAHALPTGAAAALVDFARLLERAAVRAPDEKTRERMLESARRVIHDLGELKARTADAREHARANAGNADRPPEPLHTALATAALLDHYGQPVTALWPMLKDDRWVDLVVGPDLRPLVMPGPVTELSATGRYAIMATPPGIEPRGFIEAGLDADDEPMGSIVHVVTPDGDVPVADPGPSGRRDPRSLAGVLVRARDQHGGYRTRAIRTASGATVRGLIDAYGRVILCWSPAGLADEATHKLTCPVVSAESGLILAVVDSALRPEIGPEVIEQFDLGLTQPVLP